MRTGFHDRITLCSNCGAPLQASASAAPTRCTRCGVENQVVARVDDAITEGWSEDEVARVAQLRRQDCAFVPHPSITHFAAGMRLASAHAAQAFQVWQHMRAGGGPEDAFAQLTTLLAWRAAEDGDPHRERGLLESALAVARLPRHLNQLRAALAILACRMQDVNGAESWLATCDPRPVDLHSDSAYRIARAYVDTARGNFSNVILTLGGNAVEIPIVDELAGFAAYLRANAWEKLGRPATALELLLNYKFEGNPFGQQRARTFLGVARGLDLCPGTEPEAERQRQLTLVRRRITWTTGMVVVLALSLYFFLSGAVGIGIGMLSLSVASVPEAGDLFTYVFFAVILAIPGGLLLLLLIAPLRRTRNERALLHRGQIAPARCQPGAQIIHDAPAYVLVDARAWIVPDHDPPFEKHFTLKTNSERVAEFMAGKPFSVRWLGNDFLIEPSLR